MAEPTAADRERAAKLAKEMRDCYGTNELKGSSWFDDDEAMKIALKWLAEARQQQVWPKIETAPKDGTPVLLSWPTQVIGDGIFLRGATERWVAGDWDVSPPPTHWMPLPSPPMEASDGKP